MLYLFTVKSCWVLVYSALLMALFSGENFEDMIAGLTYPCTLPPGWSIVWEGSSAGADASPSEWCLVWALSRCHVIVSYRVFTFRWINEVWWTVVVKTSIVLLSLLSELVCNNFKFLLQDSVMYEMRVVVLSGLAFVWGLLIRSRFFVALIEILLEEPPRYVRVGSELPLQRWLAH